MWWKLLLFIGMTFVCIAGFAFPIVDSPQSWYEFPNIPGLEDKARIILFHVPTAWLTVIAFFMSTVYSIQYLRKKTIESDIKAFTSAQIGIIFCILATVTGSVWAKFTWGSFWHWDPRETSIFALLLIYGALFSLRSAIPNEERKASLSAVYSIIAFLTVPFFVFIMPRIMVGLHPGSSDDTSSGPVVDFHMNGNMLMVFILSLAVFTILYICMWKLGYRSLRLKHILHNKTGY